MPLRTPPTYNRKKTKSRLVRFSHVNARRGKGFSPAYAPAAYAPGYPVRRLSFSPSPRRYRR